MLDPVSKTVTVTLDINRGITLEKLSQTTNNRIFSEAKPENNINETFDIPITISREDFKKEIYSRIQKKWGIDVPTHRLENGGTGVLGSLICHIDVEDKQTRNAATIITIPNDESWDAATYLMKSARGKIEIKFTFAVQRAKWYERQALYFLMGHGMV